MLLCVFFFFKQKTAYEMRISDWSSDVCSSDLTMGRKRHAMVDTDGRALIILVHPADVQDRDGAVPLLQQSHQRHPFVARAYADSAYNSDRVRDATSITIEIVRKFADQTGFVVHPRRWIVERTFAW